MKTYKASVALTDPTQPRLSPFSTEVDSPERTAEAAVAQMRLAMVEGLNMTPQETMLWQLDSLCWLDERSERDWCPSCKEFRLLDVPGEKYYDEDTKDRRGQAVNRSCEECGSKWYNEHAERYAGTALYAPCCGEISSHDKDVLVAVFDKPIYVDWEYECWNCNKKIRHQGNLKSTPLIVIGDL